MAHFEFKLPDVGEGVAEGEVVAWHVAEGDEVREDQEMVEVMTDKATVCIGAPRAGRIVKLAAAVGEVVPVGSTLVVIDPSENARKNGGDRAVSQFQAPATLPPHARERAMRKRSGRPSKLPPPPSIPAIPGEATGTGTETAASAVGDIREDLPGTEWLRNAPPAGVSTPTSSAGATAAAGAEAFFVAKPLATPATRKLARDLGVDLRHVPPSGPSGRVTKKDVRGFASEPANDGGRRPGSDVVPRDEAAREERQPFVGLRRRIAQRMHDATQRAAPFTFVEEVHVDRLRALVQRLQPTARDNDVKLHYLPFIVKAVTLALQKHPMLNSMLDEDSNELVLRRYYHIGIATSTEHGLVVPVVKDADRKSPMQIAKEIQRLSEGARAGGLKPDDLRGSTFTITSLGKRSGLLATPVLNYPEVGILGVHRVKEKPVVRDGEIVIGQVMMISLSLDHRIVDGDVGASFAYEVIRYLEDPDLLLLEMS